MQSLRSHSTEFSQPVIQLRSFRKPSSTNISKLPLACRSCEVRGGCLSDQLISEPGRVGSAYKKVRIIKRGEHLFREGDVSKALYVVKSGSLKTYLTTKNGEEQVLGFSMAGDILGLDAMGAQLRTSAAVALETCSVCMLPRSRLEDTYRLAPGSTERLFALVSEELMRNHFLVYVLAKKDAEARLAEFLLGLSRRFKARGYSAQEFNLSMSRQDIGNFLGLAVETVSRVLTRFRLSGLIDINRRQVKLCDIHGITSIASA
jgi:CRP/FNR family transcriptional regulator